MRSHNLKNRLSRPQLIKKVLEWYLRNKRDLPWRMTRNPYHIWISEVMLQQTQVMTVIPYYIRFLKQYPTVEALGNAPLKKVLKSWEGMGYYQRARNLHKSAKILMANGTGKFPSHLEQMETLPGIGRSTAGAIASIAFAKRAPILDGNVRRVLCRLKAIQENPGLSHVQNQLWKISEELLPARNAGTFNQAMMDLGAMVCLPKNPSCLLCPVRTQCQAYRLGLQERIPVRGTPRQLPHLHMAVGVILNGNNILMGQRPERGLLGGLWGFPETLLGKPALSQDGLCRTFQEYTGLSLNPAGSLDRVNRTYSHKQVSYIPFLFQGTRNRHQPHSPWRWIPRTRLAAYPHSAAARHILDQLKRYWTVSEPRPIAAEDVPRYSGTSPRHR